MKSIFAIVLLFWTQAAHAQTVFDAVRGEYGSAADPATSCAINPHQLDFIANPPHAVLTWQKPKNDGVGQHRSFERYDIEDHDSGTMTLREEGDFRPDRAGGPIWEFQITRIPPGYCWRRPDWPQVQCVDQQLRCENVTS